VKACLLFSFFKLFHNFDQIFEIVDFMFISMQFMSVQLRIPECHRIAGKAIYHGRVVILEL